MVNTGISEKSTTGTQPSASVTTMNDTSISTMTTPIHTNTNDELLSSSGKGSVTISTTTPQSEVVKHSASVAKSSSTALAASGVKLESSTLGKVKVEPKDFNTVLFQKSLPPIPGVSGYNSNKVAAEMAEIDSFLASLAGGGAASNPVPNMTFGKKIKTEPAGVVKPTPVGSALGNIALSYGNSEDESSSSSSDESDDNHLMTLGSIKMSTAAAATAVVAMDTQEVEQSMKKVVVSSDSSSSSSEDELG